MQTDVGPPFRCDATQSPGRSAASSFPLTFRLVHFMLPRCRPSWLLSGFRGPSGFPRVNSRIAPIQPEERGWLKEAENQAVLTVPFQETQPSTKQHDVCYRGWYLRVPTCTAAQLGLYVFARHSGRCVWCVQSRVGHLFSGHEHLQA